MTYLDAKFSKISSGSSDDGRSLNIYSYFDTATDTLATIVASAFFNSKISLLKVGDWILCQGTDDYMIAIVTSVTTNVTVTEYAVASITDGSIVNADINASAAIAYSKLAALTSANILVGNGSNVATSVAMSGDVTISNAGVAAIASGVIVNADIAAGAAIDYSKLAALTSANILVGSAGNVATSVAVTGDVTISNAGVTAIGSGVIVNADIGAAAAIDFSKLAALTSANILVGSAGNVATAVAVTGDVTISNAGVTAIAATVIVDADINAAAAIAFSKLAGLPSANILVGSAGNVATAVAVTGDVTISDAGVTAIAATVIVDADINAAAAIAFSKLASLASANILVGSAGNVATSVAVTGDVTISNAGVTAIAADSIVDADVNTAAAIAYSKLASLASANILVGSAGNVATSVAMSGDVTISNTGVTTIGTGAVDLAMINPNTLTGTVAANVAAANTEGGMLLVHKFALVGGATANFDIVLTHKSRVIDAWVINTGLGTAGDTAQVFNGAAPITNAMSMNFADETITRTGTVDDSAALVNAGGTLRVTQTDGGGADCPSAEVYVLVLRSA